MRKSSNTSEVVYNLVCDKSGLCTYEISKKLNMSGGRIRHTLSQLAAMGLIKFKFERRNPRIKKLSFPVSVIELLPKDSRKELKKMV